MIEDPSSIPLSKQVKTFKYKLIYISVFSSLYNNLATFLSKALRTYDGQLRKDFLRVFSSAIRGQGVTVSYLIEYLCQSATPACRADCKLEKNVRIPFI